jgi:serine/threonine protein kinase
VVLRVLESGVSTSRLIDQASALADALGRLDDPRIVQVVDVGIAEMPDAADRAFVVREFVPGRTVREAAAERTLTLRDVVDVAISIGEALEAAHDAGIVHGDLRPSNILLTPESEVRLVDFGAADLVRARSTVDRILEPLRRPFLGKARPLHELDEYVAPEVRVSRPAAPSADMYATGRILAELVRDVPEAAAPGAAAERFQQVVGELLSAKPDLRPLAGELVRRLRAVDGLLATAPQGERAGAPPLAEAPESRAVNVWFEADDPVPPLVVDAWYTLGLDIGAHRKGAATEAFAEPDFGGQDELELLVSLYGDELELSSHSLALRLPRNGDSEERTFRARAREPGSAGLQIVISVLPELEILQTLELVFPVVPASVPFA